VALITCGIGPVWTLHSRDAYPGDPYFMLVLGLSTSGPTTSTECMAMPSFSGSNHEPVTLETCDPSDELQYWALG
jgi:hypothetical protein